MFIFLAIKIENFIRKKKDVFNIFAQNIIYGYSFMPVLLNRKQSYDCVIISIKIRHIYMLNM